MNPKIKWLLLLSGIVISLVFLIPAIPQDPAYHNFADQRQLLFIPNFWNVMTNMTFFISGFIGLRILNDENRPNIADHLMILYRMFYAGMFFVGLGSTYYHLTPSNGTLFWDRLPLAIVMMAFFCIVIADYLSDTWALRLLWPLVLNGMLSVLYWQLTESAGLGDLRFYAVVQFLPMLLMPIILLNFSAKTLPPCYLWMILGVYLLAKICEALDVGLYNLIGLSGHSLKHLLAGVAPLILLIPIQKNKRNLSAFSDQS